MTYESFLGSESFADDRALVILREALADDSPGNSRMALDLASDNIKERFVAGESVVDLVHLRAAVVDELLVHLWRRYANYCAGVASLVAVGCRTAVSRSYPTS